MRTGSQDGPVAATQRWAGHLPTPLWQDYDNKGVTKRPCGSSGRAYTRTDRFALETRMRPAVVSTAALFLVSLNTSCDRSPPTDPHRPLALRVEAGPVPDAKNFVAHLTGGNEVPTHDTRAAGQIKLQLSDDGTEVAYRLISSNIDNVFMAHIHVAPAGVNGPIVVFLFGPVAPGGGRVDGVLAHGTFTAADLIGPLAGHPLSDLIAALSTGGVIRNPLLGRLRELRLGGMDLGPRLADLGAQVVAWIGSSAFGLVGTATRLALNLTISLFGLFYLLLRPGETWEAVRPYIPFSAKNTEKLRQRFRDVTTSTIIGTGATAAIQGTLVGLGFWLTGLPNAVFWGVVTMVFAILPVVGSALVWGPGALALILGHHALSGVLLALGGAVIVGNLDYVIRPMVFRRWANIHPLVTLVGALAGVPYFGILGLLIGPLALSYFFELVKMYREEYLNT